jgi:leucyl aminopeptidase
MEFSIKSANLEKQRGGCLVIGVFESKKLAPSGALIDRLTDQALSKAIKRGDMQGKTATTLLLHNLPKSPYDRNLLLGLGKEQDLSDRPFREIVRASIRAISATGAADAVLCLPELPVKTRDINWKTQQIAIVTTESLYRFDQMKSKPDETKPALNKLTLYVANSAETKAAELGLKQGRAIANGMNLTKDLGNLPGNVCTPTYLAEQATALAKKHKLQIQVLERKDMEKLGMWSLLSVANGSRQPPKFIVLQYKKGKTQKPFVLVGKGITFDTGGISLKPAPEMDEMKFDMCGAASVLGTMNAVAEMDLAINLVGIIPTTENMPGGAATKPGDIVKSMSGQTIEILNTDAEGRLILCDALTYVERFDPELVIDIATLTGACVIALGHVASGLYSNNNKLAKDLLAAGDYAYDRSWQLPLWDDYQEQLKSNFADLANIGGRPAGSITAACFLANFTQKYNWAHLDIAGTAWKSGKEKGATGRPVPLLTQFLIQSAQK